MSCTTANEGAEFDVCNINIRVGLNVNCVRWCIFFPLINNFEKYAISMTPRLFSLLVWPIKCLDADC
jgi:hypothetical protein